MGYLELAFYRGMDLTKDRVNCGMLQYLVRLNRVK